MNIDQMMYQLILKPEDEIKRYTFMTQYAINVISNELYDELFKIDLELFREWFIRHKYQLINFYMKFAHFVGREDVDAVRINLPEQECFNVVHHGSTASHYIMSTKNYETSYKDSYNEEC